MMKLDLQKFAEYTATMSNDSRYTIKLTVTDTGGYDAVNNTSTVNYTLTATKSAGGGYHNEYARSPVIVTINGTKVVNTKVAFDFRGSTPKTITLASGTSGAIKHNDDGTKTISVSGTFTDGSSSDSRGTATASGTFTMITIPRSSEIGTINYIDDIGGQFDISSYASGLYTCVEIYCNSVYIKTINGVSGGINSFTLTSTELNTLYNSLKNYTNFDDITIGGQIYKTTQSWENILLAYCKTYSDSTKQTQIGSTSTSWAGVIYLSTTNLYPTFNNFTYKDTNPTITALTNNNQILLKGYSNAQIEISVANRATGNKGADITRYTFPDGLSETYSSTSPVTHTLSNYNYGNSIEVKAFDTRGFSTSKSISVASLISNYTAPILSNSIVQRKNGLEATTYFGCDLKLWNGNYATDRANEITKFQYRSKISNTETWGEWIDITDKFKTAVTGQSIDNIHLDLSSQFSIHENGTSGGFTTNTEFDIQFAVSDGIGTTIFNTDYEVAVLDAGNYLDTYMKSGNGYKYAVNGVVDPNLKNGLQVNGSLYVNGTELLNLIYPVGSIYMSVNNVSPQVFLGGTWSPIKGRFLLGQGQNDGNTTEYWGSYPANSNNFPVKEMGGEARHTLSVEEMPNHNHPLTASYTFDQTHSHGGGTYASSVAEGANPSGGTYSASDRIASAGSGYSHNNMPPYYVCYMWERTA